MRWANGATERAITPARPTAPGRANLMPLPCISRPTRKMRPAAQTQATTVANTSTTPSTGCHQAIPGGIATRAVMNIGAVNGKNDPATAIGPLGFWITTPSSSIGIAAISITGMSRLCVSLMSLAAAPTAMKSEA